ncbi:Crp/Fnr family transcriptional regulator [Oceaniglobus roseus]|uniref:Crp/Fnr family transcriptional regulator n=1 Tax=Oceaniglobus roseus TaxID=1737570 RepID=UPI000C7EA028|nr:Crp/Fnr family transcriptional regulator [Kandeliimicrobium roseum]
METGRTAFETAGCGKCPLKTLRLCRSVFGLAGGGVQPPLPRLRRIPAEARLQEEDELPRVTGVLRSGFLRTERILRDGQRTVLGFLAPGDLVGDVAGIPRGPALVAVTDAEICAFDPAALRRAMAKDAPFHATVLADVMRQHIRQLEMVWRRGALGSRERIVAFLVMATEFMPTKTRKDGSLVLDMVVSRRDWADFACTTVETICRTLGDLAERGLIAQESPGRYRIRDLAALAELARLDPLRDPRAMILDATAQPAPKGGAHRAPKPGRPAALRMPERNGAPRPLLPSAPWEGRP